MLEVVVGGEVLVVCVWWVYVFDSVGVVWLFDGGEFLFIIGVVWFIDEIVLCVFVVDFERVGVVGIVIEFGVWYL